MWISTPLKAFNTPCAGTQRQSLHHLKPHRCPVGVGWFICGVATHTFIEVHVVGEHFDVGVEDPGLANHLLQDVSYSSREDEQRDAVLMQVIKEELVALPVKTSSYYHSSKGHSIFFYLKTTKWTKKRPVHWPQHGLRLLHHNGQLVFPDLLLYQELMGFSPPVRYKSRTVLWRHEIAEDYIYIKKGFWDTHHSTMRGNFSAIDRVESISMG